MNACTSLHIIRLLDSDSISIAVTIAVFKHARKTPIISRVFRSQPKKKAALDLKSFYPTYASHMLHSLREFILQIPQRFYTLDELKLNSIETQFLLSPEDATLGSIERNQQLAAVLGGVSAWYVFGLSSQQLLYLSVGLLFDVSAWYPTYASHMFRA